MFKKSQNMYRIKATYVKNGEPMGTIVGIAVTYKLGFVLAEAQTLDLGRYGATDHILVLIAFLVDDAVA